MTRAFLVVLDSVGCGGAPDAADFGDLGANTLGHIAAACASGQAEEGRSGPLHLPFLSSLGLQQAMALATNAPQASFSDASNGDLLPGAFWGTGREISQGKDTPSGHWELAGVPVPWEWHYFPDTLSCFPDELVKQVCDWVGSDGILGNRHSSGTEILEQEGAAHAQSGWPICYTSADSVFQIAAHETHFGLDRLLDLCRAIAPTLHQMRVGRVIARPFIGDAETGYTRTANRRDFAIAPPAPTLCDWVQGEGRFVHGIGKIGDIFSGHGIDDVVKGTDAQLVEDLHHALLASESGSLTFVNLVEFDSLYGHRRDVSGYARALEWVDGEIGRILSAMMEGDLLLITADHGNDPTWHGTDHTREQVPIIGLRKGLTGIDAIGSREFSDVAASVAQHLGVPAAPPGRSFF